MNEKQQTIESDDFYCEQVLGGRIAVEKVLETADVLAFRHARPAYETHVVLIPKRHISSLLDPTLAPNELVRIMDAVRIAASQVLASTGACRVITNLGDYQDSKHLHWHLVSGERLRQE